MLYEQIMDSSRESAVKTSVFVPIKTSLHPQFAHHFINNSNIIVATSEGRRPAQERSSISCEIGPLKTPEAPVCSDKRDDQD